MATQWLVWALAALLLGFAVTCAAFVLAAARRAERRDVELGGMRRLHPRTVLRPRGRTPDASWPYAGRTEAVVQLSGPNQAL